MVDLYANVVAFRGIERLIIVLCGMIFAYLGYKLFVYGVDTGNGKLETESPLFKLTFSGSGPGLFFMAFGGLILLHSMFSNVAIDRQSIASGLTQGSNEQANAAQTIETKETLHFSALGDGACDKIRLASHNDQAADALFAYQRLGDDKTSTTLATIARNLEQQSLDNTALVEILRGIEELVCP